VGREERARQGEQEGEKRLKTPLARVIKKDALLDLAQTSLREDPLREKKNRKQKETIVSVRPGRGGNVTITIIWGAAGEGKALSLSPDDNDHD
jgi:hypothetical protein